MPILLIKYAVIGRLNLLLVSKASGNGEIVFE
jgi:hypothetical protein